MAEGNFIVKTENFEGPLELLLNLIEKRKLLINEVSLSKITDDYIEYLKSAENKNIKDNAHFILIASTLLLIKSKSLLPTLELTEEEEQSIEDLERRLKIYKRIKQAEKNIADRFMQNPSFFRDGELQTETIFAPPPKISLEKIAETVLGLVKNLPKPNDLPKAIVRNVVSLEETINNLTEKIKQKISMSFKEFSSYSKAEKVNVVISFLAMLELVKQGIIEVHQKNNFDDIEMQTKVFDTPNYS